jgi:hypothetical protein
VLSLGADWGQMSGCQVAYHTGLLDDAKKIQKRRPMQRFEDINKTKHAFAMRFDTRRPCYAASGEAASSCHRG